MKKLINYSELKYLVISAGKTGSTTLYRSLKNSIHTHKNTEFWVRYHHLKDDGITLGSVIDNVAQFRKPLLISVMRDPIARVISAFFQNLPPKKYIVEDLIKTFIETFFLNHENYYPFLDSDDFGHVNVLNLPFNKEDGYMYHDSGTVQILLLLFDRIEEWPEMIARYVDMTDFTFQPANLTDTKWYASLFIEFKSKLKIPRDFLEMKFKEHDVVLRYFYTDDQIKLLKDKWISRSDVNALPHDFDWYRYLVVNKDLPYKTEYEAISHWFLYGKQENRRYK